MRRSGAAKYQNCRPLSANTCRTELPGAHRVIALTESAPHRLVLGRRHVEGRLSVFGPSAAGSLAAHCCLIHPNAQPKNLTEKIEVEVGGGTGGDNAPPRGGGGGGIVWTPDGKSLILRYAKEGKANLMLLTLRAAK